MFTIKRSIARHSLLGVLMTATLLLGGCEKPAKPASSWESAVQGMYTANLSNDGQFGIVGSINHGGSLWDMHSKERLFNWNHTKGQYTGIVAAAFSSEGRYAATASHRTIVLWKTSTGEPIWFWTAPGDILSMALTPHGDFAVLGLDDYSAVLFDIKNGGVKRVLNHNGKVRSVAISKDARLILSGSDDETAKLWDVQSGKLLHTWQHSNQVITTALSANGKYAFTAAQADKAVIWDASSGEQVKVMPIRKSSYIAGAAYTTARFSDDEKRLLTGTNSQLVQLWNVDTGGEIKRWEVTKKDKWKPSSATVLSVSFSDQSGRYFAIASNGLNHELN